MKRKLFIVLLALTAVFAGAFGLAACGDKGESEGTDSVHDVHDYGAWEITLAPTCTESGVRKRTCECGAFQEEELMPLGHLLTEHHDAQEPSCSSAGWYAYDVCERDGCGYTTKQEIPALPHTYVNYECKDCHFKMYDVSESGLITSFNDFSITEVTVPSTAYGKQVTGIYSHAFADSNVVSVVIEEGITLIDIAAFENCSSLKHIKIPNSVTIIADGAFLECDNIEYNLDTRTNAYYLGNDSNPYLVFIKPVQNSISTININPNTKIVYYSAFSGCTSLESVTLPNNLTYGSDLFAGCTGLKTINFPSSLTAIGDSMFVKCTSLEYIEIPANITSIGNSAFESSGISNVVFLGNNVTLIGSAAFSGCKNLESIEIPASVTTIGNSAFDSSGISNVVFLGNNVTSIEGNAFGGCTNLKSIVLPDGLEKVGDYVFQNCINLEWIYLPHSVTHLGREICMAAGHDVIVFYEGTILDWTNMDKILPYYCAKPYLYSETRPTDNGNYWHWSGDLPEAW